MIKDTEGTFGMERGLIVLIEWKFKKAVSQPDIYTQAHCSKRYAENTLMKYSELSWRGK